MKKKNYRIVSYYQESGKEFKEIVSNYFKFYFKEKINSLENIYE